jgi:hypothetical protein
MKEAEQGMITPIISETREQCTEKVMPVGRRSSGASPEKRLGWSLALPKVANDPGMIMDTNERQN